MEDGQDIAIDEPGNSAKRELLRIEKMMPFRVKVPGALRKDLKMDKLIALREERERKKAIDDSLKKTSDKLLGEKKSRTAELASSFAAYKKIIEAEELTKAERERNYDKLKDITMDTFVKLQDEARLLKLGKRLNEFGRLPSNLRNLPPSSNFSLKFRLPTNIISNSPLFNMWLLMQSFESLSDEDKFKNFYSSVTISESAPFSRFFSATNEETEDEEREYKRPNDLWYKFLGMIDITDVQYNLQIYKNTNILAQAVSCGNSDGDFDYGDLNDFVPEVDEVNWKFNYNGVDRYLIVTPTKFETNSNINPKAKYVSVVWGTGSREKPSFVTYDTFLTKYKGLEKDMFIRVGKKTSFESPEDKAKKSSLSYLKSLRENTLKYVEINSKCKKNSYWVLAFDEYVDISVSLSYKINLPNVSLLGNQNKAFATYLGLGNEFNSAYTLVYAKQLEEIGLFPYTVDVDNSEAFWEFISVNKKFFQLIFKIRNKILELNKELRKFKEFAPSFVPINLVIKVSRLAKKIKTLISVIITEKEAVDSITSYLKEIGWFENFVSTVNYITVIYANLPLLFYDTDITADETELLSKITNKQEQIQNLSGYLQFFEPYSINEVLFSRDNVYFPVQMPTLNNQLLEVISEVSKNIVNSLESLDEIPEENEDENVIENNDVEMTENENVTLQKIYTKDVTEATARHIRNVTKEQISNIMSLMESSSNETHKQTIFFLKLMYNFLLVFCTDLMHEFENIAKIKSIDYKTLLAKRANTEKELNETSNFQAKADLDLGLRSINQEILTLEDDIDLYNFVSTSRYVLLTYFIQHEEPAEIFSKNFMGSTLTEDLDRDVGPETMFFNFLPNLVLSLINSFTIDRFGENASGSLMKMSSLIFAENGRTFTPAAYKIGMVVYQKFTSEYQKLIASNDTDYFYGNVNYSKDSLLSCYVLLIEGNPGASIWEYVFKHNLADEIGNYVWENEEERFSSVNDKFVVTPEPYPVLGMALHQAFLGEFKILISDPLMNHMIWGKAAFDPSRAMKFAKAVEEVVEKNPKLLDEANTKAKSRNEIMLLMKRSILSKHKKYREKAVEKKYVKNPGRTLSSSKFKPYTDIETSSKQTGRSRIKFKSLAPKEKLKSKPKL